jgi:hypothetical protein
MPRQAPVIKRLRRQRPKPASSPTVTTVSVSHLLDDVLGRLRAQPELGLDLPKGAATQVVLV